VDALIQSIRCAAKAKAWTELQAFLHGDAHMTQSGDTKMSRRSPNGNHARI
jgi:hypothetical protein